MEQTQSNDQVVDESDVKRAVSAAAMGNALEWFDFGVYSYMAGTVGHVFFPSHSGTASLLASFAVFAIAFVVRPLGGFFFGPLGDKIGRNKVLATTIIMMSAGTFVVGFLPSYQTIGIWAPILLIIARLVQGFSTGGEYGGAATFICEFSPDDRRGFMGSWLEFGTLAGYSLGAVLVTGISLLLTAEQFSDWGWRLPFLLAGPLGVFGLYLRLKLKDSPAFEEMKEQAEEVDSPLRTILVDNLRLMMLCIGLVLILNVAYYTVLTYLPSYLTEVLHMDASRSLVFLVATMLVMMCVIGFVGKLSDRVGRKPVLIGACIGFIVLSYPAFWLLSVGTLLTTIIGLAILGGLVVLLAGTMPSTLPAIFPTRIRYGGFAISYNISTSLFGGTAPFLITWLISTTGNNFVPAYYLMLAAAVAIAPIMMIPETAGRAMPGSKSLRGSGSAGAPQPA
ncbi:MFS transporter [Salinisphaera aquimarina]|uniref:MFS transporter n=1 Tax=Salinisphaera aquimarina TaxID=2094031 RepID=A0ABV7EX76_9GAMM